MEEKEDDSEYKQGLLDIGETIVGLYKIEGVTLKKENHVTYSVVYLFIFKYFVIKAIGLSNQEEEKFRIKMYDHTKKTAFDYGLSEITAYLYLYERNINFKNSGIAKMRDYFYLNVKKHILTHF